MRDSGTAAAKNHYALMLAVDEIRQSFYSEAVLENLAERKQEITTLLDETIATYASLSFHKAIILELFYKYHPDAKTGTNDHVTNATAEKSFEENLITLANEHAATGNQEAEEMLNAMEELNYEDKTNSASSDKDQVGSSAALANDSQTDDDSSNEAAPAAVAASLATKAHRQSPAKGMTRQKRIEAMVMKFAATRSDTSDKPSSFTTYQVVWADDLKKSAKHEEVMRNHKNAFEKLLKSIAEGTNEGRPKALHGETSLGLRQFSRRITEEHRLVYAYDHVNKTIHILECGGHYGD